MVTVTDNRADRLRAELSRMWGKSSEWAAELMSFRLLCIIMALLSDVDRRKLDDSLDGQFYDSPRFVTHADDGFLDRLTTLYDDQLTPGDRVFDAMGSWVSHLPATSLGRVVGHGLNEAELKENERLDEYFVQNFNENQSLPLETDSMDAVCCALSVQYLEYPGAVFSEFARVLDDGGVLIVSFSNRMFPTKAVNAWRSASMTERGDLVASYAEAGGLPRTDQIVDRPSSDPFYAVIAKQ